MQVYRDLRILTARPTREEEDAVPHLLFGHVDGAVNYSVGLWLKDFADVLARLEADGRTAVVVGGTGMYFKAALQGLSDIPAVPDDVRARVREEAQGRAPQELHARLAARDPETAARLRPTDPQRILRALEIFEATGKPLSSFHATRQRPLIDATDCAAFFIAPERETLFTRIDARFDKMLEAGALEEIRALAARRLDPALPVMRAHGAPHLLRWLEGDATLEDAARLGKADTRHYAKRQFTFARHQLKNFVWLDPRDAEQEALARLNDRPA
jgi:tRNA dimethylallyltransferase